MEETVKKREWVKNAAIIFLSIMLVLTFFSNTFMNRTLPEVSTQQVSSGAINTKIRGSGTVTANTTHEVMLEQTRTVDTVLVKNGQEVAAGDILFTLKASDSDELETAKTALETAELNYKIAMLEAGKGGSNSTSDAASSARSEYYAAQQKTKNVRDALAKIKAIQADKANLEVLAGGADKLAEIVNLMELKDEAAANAESFKKKAEGIQDQTSDEYINAIKSQSEWLAAVTDYTDRLTALNIPGSSYDTLYTNYKNNQSQYNSLVSTYGELTDADYQSAVNAEESARKAYNTASDALDAAMKDERIDSQIDSLKNAQTEKEIQKLREKVNELSAKDEGNEIKAKVGGVIGDLNITSGSIIQPATAVATIQQKDRGYSVKISVTAEQAKKVNIGDTADVGNYYWWGDAITATLSNITTDPSSAGRNKFLIFDVAGEVDVGTNLEISIGQKSANYDAIVPNSALRNDTNGDFVLAITLKSSPLGNRYVATRVDIKILAKDDTSAAITGIASGEYVITTSSKPIEAGQLVRMAEG